jgi:hypothetical protein
MSVLSSSRSAQLSGLSPTSLSFRCLHRRRAAGGPGFCETPVVANHVPTGKGRGAVANHALNRTRIALLRSYLP